MMKTKLITSVLGLIMVFPVLAQDRTTVNATSSEISDNLDLRAVASIFGEARNLEDFERQLNDPNAQISNLDLNNDNRVDYLRVIETVEGYTHLIVVQSVLGLDTYQDVATIEVERDRHNQVTVQVVGDVYMYGANYIYEPVYVRPPVIYASFWVNHYRPYCSTWYWDYYPSYYAVWSPCPIFRYRNNINVYINFSNRYNYVNVRRCDRAVALYSTRRANYCERQYPMRSFAYRNENVRNRYELDQARPMRNVSSRNNAAYNTRNGNGNQSREYNAPGRTAGNRTNASESRAYNPGRGQANTRNNPGSVRENGNPRNSGIGANSQRNYGNRDESSPRSESNSGTTYGNRAETNRNSSERDFSRNESRGNRNIAQRMESNRQYNPARVESGERTNGNSGRDFNRNESRGNGNISQRMESGRQYNPARMETGGRANGNSSRDFNRNESRGNGNMPQRMESGSGNREMRGAPSQQNNRGNGGAQRNTEQSGGRR